MRKTRIYVTLGCCFVAMAIFAWAQVNRKPGLWEMTSTMTWQQSPMPPGMTMPAGANNPFGGGPRTTQVCLTQAMIDKFGAPLPQSRNGQCQISNVSLKPTSMSADWICTGMMTGKGTLESSWTDPDHAVGTHDSLTMMVSILIFVAILLLAYIYAWAKGVFRWD